MLLLLAALTIGLILSLLALGSFISFRVFEFPDITTEGSFTLGGAIAATLLVLDADAVEDRTQECPAVSGGIQDPAHGRVDVHQNVRAVKTS